MEGGHRKDQNGRRSHCNESGEQMRHSRWDNRHPDGTKRPVAEEGLLQLSAA